MAEKSRNIIFSSCNLTSPATCNYQRKICAKIANPESDQEKTDRYCQAILCNVSSDCAYKETSRFPTNNINTMLFLFE